MTNARLALIALTLLGLILIAAISWRADAVDEAPDASPVPVPILRVQMQDHLEISSTWPGTISARRQSHLGFERSGLIKRVYVDTGDFVKKGDRLASLNTTAQSADLAAAKAISAQSQAALNISAATAKRQQSLANSGHISSQRLEEFLANQASADAALGAAKAQANAILARLSLSHIIAPYDGTITARHMDEGTIAGPGAAVLELVESEHLELKVGLPVNIASSLALGDLVQVNIGHGVIQAKMRRSTNVVNPVTQTVDTIFNFTGEGAKPVSGQSARIQLQDQLLQRGFLVPISALREGNRGLWSLYTLLPQKDDQAYILSPVPVEIIHAGEREVYVRGPIKNGSMILRAAGQNTSVGMRVLPMTGSGNE
ncbi:MAG: hypothetical protein COA47_09860 [Robiginitomaculum sp.]|nr:MAG: hypothetical protein COA47_09860 [Robiginitomaculum sp.]